MLVFFINNLDILIFVAFADLNSDYDLGLFTIYHNEAMIYLLSLSVAILTLQRIDVKGGTLFTAAFIYIIGKADLISSSGDSFCHRLYRTAWSISDFGLRVLRQLGFDWKLAFFC